MPGRRGALVFVAASLAACATTVPPREARAQAVYELRRDIPVDVGVTVAAAAFMIITETYKDHLAPQMCRWCDFDGKGRDVLNPVDHGMRELSRWKDNRPALRIADATAFVLAPTASISTMMAAAINDRAEIKYPTDMLLVLEAVALAGVVNQALKFTFARERPFVHVLTEDEKPRQSHPSDNNLSFYSGHTTLSFAIATASGTIASLRDYRLKHLVWGTLVPMAALTGFLRIAGDRHYFTDVLTGAVLGSAVGILVPLVFHGRDGKDTVPFSTEDQTPVGPGPASAPMVTISGGF